MNNSGFIYVYRNVRDHWLWRDPKKFLRWTDLVMEAAWEPMQTVFGNTLIRLNRGQLVTSVRLLMHRWGTNSRYVTDFLTLLAAERMITFERSRAYTIITIMGYDVQQGGSAGESLPPKTENPEHKWLHQESHEASHSKEDNINNNNNIINSSTIPVEERNFEFVELIKTNDLAIEQAMVALKCSKDKLLEMLEIFVNDSNFTSKGHSDFNDFKSHFIHWSRIHLGKERRNGNGKQKNEGGGNSQDRYANRRGTDAKDHTAEDYDGSF